jgi:hypothetical protein
MRNIKKRLLRGIEAKAKRRTGRLASELVRAQSKDKELILAELEFQRWLTDTCGDCLDEG